ncbi:hypothetical protein ACIHCQ_35890 [Streptomyces sp. NPDC052236]|uniref:hypothetical protein n=1 Tax=Streptomyces sp. NPDC052236 TaxID=3365686 RepID=UPI0037D702C9
MSCTRLIAKLETYDAYRAAPPTGRGNAARPARRHWQEHFGGHFGDKPFPPPLFVFAPAPRRAAPKTREAAFRERARAVVGIRHRQLIVATTTLPRLTAHGPGEPVWRVATPTGRTCSPPGASWPSPQWRLVL